MNINLNGNNIRWNTYRLLNVAISHSMLEGDIWNQLQYEPYLHPENDDDIGFKLTLKCNLFKKIETDLKKLEKVERFQLLILNFNYNTDREDLTLKDFVECFQYLLISLFLNLEFRYPFVFSFYGRRLFQNNYPWLIKQIDLLFTEAETNTVLQKNKNKILRENLRRIQEKILSEYNTLNIMKECDLSYSRRQSCQCYKSKHLGNVDYQVNNSIKNMIFHLNFLDIKKIEAVFNVDLI